jgi:glyoxylase-like metal-dependent hydrolase (beta-lactamase superfamily II)
MTFLSEPEPPYGVAASVYPGVRRLVARNPGPMTYHGTNTYIVERGRELLVLDPGPDDSDHISALASEVGSRLRYILLTHAHRDHSGAVAALKRRTGATVYGYRVSASADFTPDMPLDDGDEVAGLRAIHTPGHAPDHLCFAAEGGLLFSGDHVMSWSSTVIPTRTGDMAAYYSSLRRLLDRDEIVYLPGHGPPLPSPQAYVRNLLRHREQREEAIVDAIRAQPLTASDVTERLYGKTNPVLRVAAEHNVNAHLRKLETEGRVHRVGDGWSAAETL